jgi:hypothetical protein
MIILFTPDDLVGSIKDVPIDAYSFKGSTEPVTRADLVLYVDGTTVKVLKNRYGPNMTFDVHLLSLVVKKR